MDTDQLNRWLSLLANAGVIAGIFFLALELRQNNQYMAEESKYGQLQNRIEFNRDLIDNPEYASLYYEVEGEEEIDRFRRFAAVRRAFLLWQWEFESIWWSTRESQDHVTTHWRRIYHDHNFHEFWNSEKDTFSPPFVEYIDNFVAK